MSNKINKGMPTMSQVHVDVPIENKRKILKASCEKLIAQLEKIKLDKINVNHDEDGKFSSIAEESSRSKQELIQRIAQDNKGVDRNYYLNNYRGKAF